MSLFSGVAQYLRYAWIFLITDCSVLCTVWGYLPSWELAFRASSDCSHSSLCMDRKQAMHNQFFTHWGLQSCRILTLTHTEVRFSCKVLSFFSSSLWFRLYIRHDRPAFSRWCITAVAHAFPPVSLFISQSERDVVHHYLEFESVWSSQFGLYSMVWGGVHCLLWVVLFTEAYSPGIPS